MQLLSSLKLTFYLHYPTKKRNETLKYKPILIHYRYTTYM